MKWSKGGDVAQWLEMVGERGRGSSTAQGLRAEFIPLDKVAPHPPSPCHVGLIPWDKLAEPACLRITSPRYTFAYNRYRTNLTVRVPFLRCVSDSRKLATNCSVVVCFSDWFFFSFAHILRKTRTINQANEPIYDIWKARSKKMDSSVGNFSRRLMVDFV